LVQGLEVHCKPLFTGNGTAYTVDSAVCKYLLAAQMGTLTAAIEVYQLLHKGDSSYMKFTAATKGEEAWGEGALCVD